MRRDFNLPVGGKEILESELPISNCECCGRRFTMSEESERVCPKCIAQADEADDDFEDLTN